MCILYTIAVLHQKVQWYDYVHHHEGLKVQIVGSLNAGTAYFDWLQIFIRKLDSQVKHKIYIVPI